MLKPYLRNVSGKPSKSDITLFTGGLNTCEDKSMIRDNQMPYMWNMTLNKGMSMTTRTCRETLALYLNDTNNWGTGEIKKIFQTSDKTILIIEKHSNQTEVYELKKVSKTSIAKDYIGTVEDSIFYSITECRDSDTKYFMISTLNKLYMITKDPLTETLTDVTSTSNNTVGILAAHKNRLWVANGLSLKFSTLREYTDFMSNYEVSYVQGDTDYFTINKDTFLASLASVDLNIGYYRVRSVNSGGTITTTIARYDAQNAYWSTSPTIPTTGISTVNTQSGDEKEIYITVGTDGTAGEINITNANGNITALVPFDDKLIILCERSMHILYGDSPLSEVNQFSVVDLNNGLGCVSDETWTICNKQLFWLDTDMSVYRYNGAGIVKISEPYGGDNYASYGGISGIKVNSYKIKNFVMSSCGDCIYIAITYKATDIDPDYPFNNDTLLVYNTKNRVWWAEDGAFKHMCMWEVDSDKLFYNQTDCLLGVTYNDDILNLIVADTTPNSQDKYFNMTTRHIDEKEIQFAFETKTWTLGTVKKEKTLTNLWFQANADGRVGVCDYWNQHNPWDEVIANIDNNYLVLGELHQVTIRHDVKNPTHAMHQGGERQRFIIPRMYMQKINAFSIRVEGTGQAEFYMMEKEWRIK